MTGSALSLGVDGGKVHVEAAGQPGTSPLRKGPQLHSESKAKTSLRVSEKTWESRRIKEEMQEILSPTPLELHKVHSGVLKSQVYPGRSPGASIKMGPHKTCLIKF